MVLGAGIFSEEVTTLLAARLDKALSVYHSQRTKPIIIVSGGQGPDEPISEALAMKRYLIAHNVPENHIFMENQSTNTQTISYTLNHHSFDDAYFKSDVVCNKSISCFKSA